MESREGSGLGGARTRQLAVWETGPLCSLVGDELSITSSLPLCNQVAAVFQ